jgi:ribosome maturation factor RimP
MYIGLEKKIFETINETVENMGFEIVRLKLTSNSVKLASKKILEILIARKDEQHVSIGDCRSLSHQLSAVLDVEDVIEGKYNLEIASAGVERPLVKLSDFEKYKHYVIKLKLHKSVNDSKKYQCKILDVIGDKINCMLDNKEHITIEYDNVKDAHLVLTDDLYRKIVNKGK